MNFIKKSIRFIVRYFQKTLLYVALIPLFLAVISCEDENNVLVFSLPEDGWNEYVIPKGQNYSDPQHSGHTRFKSDTFEVMVQFDTSMLFTDTISYKSKITGVYENADNNIRLAYSNITESHVSSTSDTLSLYWYLHVNGNVITKYICTLSKDQVLTDQLNNQGKKLVLICAGDKYYAQYEHEPVDVFERKMHAETGNEKRLLQPFHGGSNTIAPHNIYFRIDYLDMKFYKNE
jgi:hypothetical protein